MVVYHLKISYKFVSFVIAVIAVVAVTIYFVVTFYCYWCCYCCGFISGSIASALEGEESETSSDIAESDVRNWWADNGWSWEDDDGEQVDTSCVSNASFWADEGLPNTNMCEGEAEELSCVCTGSYDWRFVDESDGKVNNLIVVGNADSVPGSITLHDWVSDTDASIWSARDVCEPRSSSVVTKHVSEANKWSDMEASDDSWCVIEDVLDTSSQWMEADTSEVDFNWSDSSDDGSSEVTYWLAKDPSKDNKLPDDGASGGSKSVGVGAISVANTS